MSGRTDNIDDIRDIRNRRRENGNGVTEIPDDTPKRRVNENKRKIARSLKRITDKRSVGAGRARLTPLSGVIIIALILIIVFVAADLNTGGLLSTVNGRIVSAVSRKSSEKFSVGIDAQRIFDFDSFDNGYIMLTENGISYVNSSGKLSAKQQLSYSYPSVDINGSSVIIFDRGNASYSIERNKNLVSQLSVDGSIVDAAVSSRDNYAVAVRTDNSRNILYGMDSGGKIIYQWNCPKGYITDVVITNSGGKAAVTVIDSENAVLSSEIYILDFEYDSAYAQFNYPDETVIGTKFLSGKKIQVITDKKVYLINGREQSIVYEYGSSDICFTEIGNDRYTAILTKDYSHDDKYTLAIFTSGGKLKSDVSVLGKVRGISASSKSIAVLFSDKIETYSKRGKLVGYTEGINYYDDIVLCGNYIYLLSSDSVKKYPAYGTSGDVQAEDGTD